MCKCKCTTDALNHSGADRTPSASQMLAALAFGRGWTTGAGLPDEARAGRQVLKDFCDGKLVSFCLPPGTPPLAGVLPGVSAPLPGTNRRVIAADAPAAGGAVAADSAADRNADAAAASGDGDAAVEPPADQQPGQPSTDSAAAAGPGAYSSAAAAAAAARQGPLPEDDEEISEADLALMQVCVPPQ